MFVENDWDERVFDLGEVACWHGVVLIHQTCDLSEVVQLGKPSNFYKHLTSSEVIRLRFILWVIDRV